MIDYSLKVLCVILMFHLELSFLTKSSARHANGVPITSQAL